jgi:hypothetical protein
MIADRLLMVTTGGKRINFPGKLLEQVGCSCVRVCQTHHAVCARPRAAGVSEYI